MGTGARNYTGLTLKKLFGLSGNQCAFPGCDKVMVNQKNAKDSNICHIEAANEEGERYNPKMKDKQRADYENLILLCVQHHDETNDESIYTVEVLKRMKREHEILIGNQRLSRNPSMLVNAVNAIAGIDVDADRDEGALSSYNIGDKIKHNNLSRYVPLIDEYKAHHKKINSLYDELESQGSIKKNRILDIIKQFYVLKKGDYLVPGKDEMEVIRNHADDIFKDVIDELYSKLEDSKLWEEDIIFGVNLIAVDAFMRCKILEEPA